MPASCPAPPLPDPPLDELLRGVLDVSLTGLVYYLPVFDSAGSGEVVDFAFNYLNPLFLPLSKRHERTIRPARFHSNL
jgi:hypothetical protein